MQNSRHPVSLRRNGAAGKRGLGSGGHQSSVAPVNVCRYRVCNFSPKTQICSCCKRTFYSDNLTFNSWKHGSQFCSDKTNIATTKMRPVFAAGEEETSCCFAVASFKEFYGCINKSAATSPPFQQFQK